MAMEVIYLQRSREILQIMLHFIKYSECKKHFKKKSLTSAYRREDVGRAGSPSGCVNMGQGGACAAICKHECRAGPTEVTNGP